MLLPILMLLFLRRLPQSVLLVVVMLWLLPGCRRPLVAGSIPLLLLQLLLAACPLPPTSTPVSAACPSRGGAAERLMLQVRP